MDERQPQHGTIQGDIRQLITVQRGPHKVAAPAEVWIAGIIQLLTAKDQETLLTKVENMVRPRIVRVIGNGAALLKPGPVNGGA